MFLGLTREIFAFPMADMVDFEYILKVWLDFSTTVPLGRYLMGRTLQDAPETFSLLFHQSSQWPGRCLSGYLFLSAGYWKNFLFTFIKVKLIHWMLLWSFPVSWLLFHVWLLLWEHFKAKWFSFDKQSKCSWKKDTFFLSFFHLRGWGCVWILRYHSFQLSRRSFGASSGTWSIFFLTLGHKRFFWVFFLEDKTSAPDVFSSCSFIARAHFESNLVMVSFYGYEIWCHT